MAAFVSLLSLLPLLSVYALPQAPDVHVTNNEIIATGPVTACSTITKTMGTLVDIIPVPCPTDGSPLPPIFTELVDADGTSASLIVAPSAVDFISQSWLNQSTAIPSTVTPSNAPSASASVTGSSSGPAGSGSSSAPRSGNAVSGSLGSGIPATTAPPVGTGSSSAISPALGTGSSKTVTPPLGTGSSSGVSPPSGIGSSSSISPPLGTGTSKSVTPPLGTGSSSAPSSVVPPIGPGSSNTVSPPLGTGSSKSVPLGTGSSNSVLPPIGTPGSSSVSPPLGTGSSSSVSPPLGTGPSSSSGSNSASGSASQTASPGSTSANVPSSTPGSITSAPGASSSSAPFVPVTSPASTIAGVGPVASSSAKAIQTSLSSIIPVIQIYINKPSCASCGTDAINALRGVLPTIETLSDEIGPGPSSHACDASPNLLADIFNAVKCAAQYAEDAITHIQGGEDDIDDLTKDVGSLTDIQEPLGEDNGDDDDNNSSQSQDQSSQESSQESSTQTSSSASSSASSSGSSSSSSSSSASSSASSSGSCLLPPEVTLPPDSLAGGAQPDQPTSVVVTGLPSFDGSASGSGSGSASATGSGSAAPSGSSSLPSVTGSASGSGSYAAPGSTASSGGSSITNAGSSAASSTAPPSSITSAPPKSTVASNFCMTDGAPWFSPTAWCDCGASATYPLRSVSGASTGDCAYTTLPDSTIQPVSTSAAPTNIPGEGGLPGCRYVLYPDGQGCPYANYCDCGGTYAPLLTVSTSGTSSLNCDYTIQPTANNCPTPTFTPTSTPPPPSSTPPPAPSPNVAIIIYREDSCGDIYAGCSSDGRVYDITPGEPVDVCGHADTVATFDYTEDVQNETEDYDVSTPKFTSHDTFKNCQYSGTADHVGTFNCDGFPSPVSCITPAATAADCSGGHSLDEDEFVPIVYCEWYKA